MLRWLDFPRIIALVGKHLASEPAGGMVLAGEVHEGLAVKNRLRANSQE